MIEPVFLMFVAHVLSIFIMFALWTKIKSSKVQFVKVLSFMLTVAKAAITRTILILASIDELEKEFFET